MWLCVKNSELLPNWFHWRFDSSSAASVAFFLRWIDVAQSKQGKIPKAKLLARPRREWRQSLLQIGILLTTSLTVIWEEKTLSLKVGSHIVKEKHFSSSQIWNGRKGRMGVCLFTFCYGNILFCCWCLTSVVYITFIVDLFWLTGRAIIYAEPNCLLSDIPNILLYTKIFFVGYISLNSLF